MELQVEKREVTGKAVRRLRAAGLVPGELYGHGKENAHVSVSAKTFSKVFRDAGESTMVNLVLEGETHPVMIHEVQRDPLSDAVLSVDFYEVRLDEQVRVFVPIVFTGTSPAVKDLGGFLVKSMHEIELEGFPQHMPHELTVSIEGLGEIGQSLYVKDMRFPEGVKTHTASETVIATVTEKAAEEEVPVEPVSVDSVKVEAEEKKAERDARKEAGGEER